MALLSPQQPSDIRISFHPNTPKACARYDIDKISLPLRPFVLFFNLSDRTVNRTSVLIDRRPIKSIPWRPIGQGYYARNANSLKKRLWLERYSFSFVTESALKNTQKILPVERNEPNIFNLFWPGTNFNGPGIVRKTGHIGSKNDLCTAFLYSENTWLDSPLGPLVNQLASLRAGWTR